MTTAHKDLPALLSARIRPNVEAAPWVIEEIKKLEADAAQEAGRDAALEEAALACDSQAVKLFDLPGRCSKAVSDCADAIRALKAAQAQPAVDLVAAILALEPEPPRLTNRYAINAYCEGHEEARDAAAALARAQLEGKS